MIFSSVIFSHCAKSSFGFPFMQIFQIAAHLLILSQCEKQQRTELMKHYDKMLAKKVY